MNLNTCIMIYILAVFILTGFCFWISHSGWVFLLLFLLAGLGESDNETNNCDCEEENKQ